MTRRDGLRELLRWAIRLGSVAPLALFASSCSQTRPCDDASQLSTPDQLRRTSVEYTSTSPDSETCASCEFFASADPGPCGTCSLVPGPIDPGARCNLWAVA